MRMTILAGLIVGVSLAFQSAHGAQARNKGGQAAAVVHPRRFRARRLPQQEALARRLALVQLATDSPSGCIPKQKARG